MTAKYSCDLCGTVFNTADLAYACEALVVAPHPAVGDAVRVRLPCKSHCTPARVDRVIIRRWSPTWGTPRHEVDIHVRFDAYNVQSNDPYVGDETWAQIGGDEPTIIAFGPGPDPWPVSPEPYRCAARARDDEPKAKT